MSDRDHGGLDATRLTYPSGMTEPRAGYERDVSAGRAAGDTPANGGFLSEHPQRRTFESVVVRVVATAGIVGVGTALGAILIAADVAGWVTGLVVSIVTVVLAAMLWRSRRL